MKTLIIIGCSKKKRQIPLIQAGDLYQGSLFSLGKQLAISHGYDYAILSAKYGLIKPTEIIAPYDSQLLSFQDVKKIEKLVMQQISLFSKYDSVLIVCGKFYQIVFFRALSMLSYDAIPFTSIYQLEDKRGIGGLMQKIKQLIENKHPQLIT